MNENNELDTSFLINQAFLGYKYRKREKKLYEKDGVIPAKLIRLYYSFNHNETEFNNLKKSFMNKYVKNESKLEGVNDESIHSKAEIMGLADMYEYLHSKEFDEEFSIYSIKELNRLLFSHIEHPENAGKYRTEIAMIKGIPIDLCDYSMISSEIFFLAEYVDQLREKGKNIRKEKDADKLIAYIEECVLLKCKLIWIHPFKDGNGRTIRAFINKLLEDAGLPPIYIKSTEIFEYQDAMKSAIGDNDYSLIQAFYKYKICDSLIELDINDRIKKEDKNLNIKKRRKQINKI